MLGAKIVIFNYTNNCIGPLIVDIVCSILNCGVLFVRASIVGFVCCEWSSAGVENLRFRADPDSFERHSMVILVDSDGSDVSRRFWIHFDVKVSLFFFLKNCMDIVLIDARNVFHFRSHSRPKRLLFQTRELFHLDL